MLLFDTIKKTEYCTSVALGFFDGVHKGHRDVIKKAKAFSSPTCPVAVLTFKNSPALTFTGKEKPLLTTNEQKFELFESLGMDIVFCIDFDDVKDMTAQQFVSEVLYKQLNAKFVTTGFNYHFGKGGTSDADDMLSLCKELGIQANKCDPVMYENAPVSSTRIRECISAGEIESANEMLCYDFAVREQIVGGNHIGRKLDSPTINQHLTGGIVTPKFGVYATKVTVDGNTYIGATNIGTHPTVGGDTPVCETHLLDFESGDLYGKIAHTKLLKFIRPEQKFDSIAELKAQIDKDKQQILNYFK